MLGRDELDTVLVHREDLNERLRNQIADQTTSWGVEVRLAEIKDVEIPEAMQPAGGEALALVGAAQYRR